MLSLLGVLVVIIGFALKLEPIAIIVVSAIVTAVCGGINVVDLLTSVGTTFVANCKSKQALPANRFVLVHSGHRCCIRSVAASACKRYSGCYHLYSCCTWYG